MSSRKQNVVGSTKDRVSIIDGRFTTLGNATGSLTYCSDAGATISGTSPGLFTVTLSVDNKYPQFGGYGVGMSGTAASYGQYQVQMRPLVADGKVEFRVIQISGSNVGLTNPASASVEVGFWLVARNTDRSV